MNIRVIFSSLVLSSILFSQEISEVTNQKENQENIQEVLIENELNTEILLTSISSKEVFEKIKINNNQIIIDIRSPQNLALKGTIKNEKVLHIAFENFNVNKYNFVKNKYFFDELKYELTMKNLDFEKQIYIIDNYSDIDALEIGKFLNELGYLNVTTITDGFEGSKAKYGKFKNRRVVNGWKNTTDAWEYSTSFSNYWTPCKYSFLFEPDDKTACEVELSQVNQNITGLY